ncbi:MAG: cache domain-containing protein [Pseudomonadota bacterium]
MKKKSVKWHKSLSFQGIIGLAFISLLFVLGIVLIMSTSGKELISVETSKVIEEIGNNAVSRLTARSSEIAALTRTLAATTENLPKSETSFKEIIPKLIYFQGDLDVAGGGVWPEPYAFQPDKQRRSFFWGRESDGSLKYYDDYNQPGAGYHNEEWYVAVRHAKPGTCSWSESYMDPYSYQPMVTCTVATFDQQRNFSGTVTIDLKLEGLQAIAKTLQKETGGYVFILDRNNKFITFPKPALVKQIGQDSQGNRTEEFLFASEFAKKSPLFLPLSEAFKAMNQDILMQARKLQNYKSNIALEIDRDSYQIDRPKAELLSAVIANPFKNTQTKLYKKVTLENDFLLNEASTAFIFLMPDSYWKLVIVKPNAEINAVATNIIQLMIIYLVATALLILGIAYFVFIRKVVQPLALLSRATHQLAQGDLTESKDDRNKLTNRQDEIGEIEQAVYALNRYFNAVIGDIIQISQGLAVGHLHITPKAEYKGEFVQIKNALVNLVDTTKQNASQDWIKTGQTQLNDHMSGGQDIVSLAKNIISFLTTYIEAQIGLFYLLKEDYLQVIASYGYTNSDNQPERFLVGEGLVGQAAMEQKMLFRTYTQEEYQFIIQSVLTRAIPRQVLIVPFLYEKAVKGVIEICFSEEIATTTQREFLEHVMPSIGIAVNTADLYLRR